MIEDKPGYLCAKPEVYMPAVASVTFDMKKYCIDLRADKK